MVVLSNECLSKMDFATGFFSPEFHLAIGNSFFSALLPEVGKNRDAQLFRLGMLHLID